MIFFQKNKNIFKNVTKTGFILKSPVVISPVKSFLSKNCPLESLNYTYLPTQILPLYFAEYHKK